MGHITPFSGHNSRNAAEDDPRATTQHTPAERRGAPESKTSVIEQLAYTVRARFHHRPTGDPLHNCRQASDSQLLTSWVIPEQESRPCHVCPRAVGMVHIAIYPVLYQFCGHSIS